MFGIDLAALIETIGYAGLFAIIFAESGTIVGFFLPGASLLFTAGLLSSQGYLNIWYLAPLLGLAAILGDNVGYWFGAKVGPRLFTREDSFFFHKKHIDRTREFFEKYGSKTILIARFVPFVRTFAPILAGVGSMHYGTFVLYNVIGALAWASGITILGFTVGSTVPGAEKYLEVIILALITVTLIPLARELWRERAAKRALTRPLKAIMFDKDNTITDAKQPLERDVARLLSLLTRRMPVGIMSGQMWKTFHEQVVENLAPDTNLANLYLMPNNSAECYAFEQGAWRRVYDHSFSQEEKTAITAALEAALEETGMLANEPAWGERIEDRGSQIALSALGQEAPLEPKKAWDPDRKKRKVLVDILVPRLPDCTIQIGGVTTIDITRRGIDKAVGVDWLAKHLGIAPEEMLYVGDALFPGGNDTAVIPTGIRTRQVLNHKETAGVIETILAAQPKVKV